MGKGDVISLVKNTPDERFNLNKHFPALSFAWTRRNLDEVLVDDEWASLGDSLANFVHSLAISNRRGKPLSTKAKGSVLAEALRNAQRIFAVGNVDTEPS